MGSPALPPHRHACCPAARGCPGPGWRRVPFPEGSLAGVQERVSEKGVRQGPAAESPGRSLGVSGCAQAALGPAGLEHRPRGPVAWPSPELGVRPVWIQIISLEHPGPCAITGHPHPSPHPTHLVLQLGVGSASQQQLQAPATAPGGGHVQRGQGLGGPGSPVVSGSCAPGSTWESRIRRAPPKSRFGLACFAF